MNPSSEGEATSLLASDEDEFLKATWDRLGVGQDGLLSLEDLSKVCTAIGLDADAIQEIKRLFGRLDADKDGMINFQEFLLIFQSTSSANTSQVYDDSLQDIAQTVEGSGPSFHCPMELGTLSSLDPQQTGYVNVNDLSKVLRDYGVTHGHRVLRDLCLPYRDGEKIRLRDLIAALDEECRVPTKESNQGISTKQAALLLAVNEVKNLRQTLEKVREERDQYRWSLKEENHKVELMSQEMEEHHHQADESNRQKLGLEKQIRDLQESLKRQKEKVSDAEKEEHHNVLQHNASLKEEEIKLKNLLLSKADEIRSLENDNIDLTDKLRESQFQLQLMEKELSDMKILEDKVAELECITPRENEFKALLQKVDLLTSENNHLKDSNDELVAQIDSLSSKASTVKQEDISLDGSVIGDYVDSSTGLFTGGLKRRGDTSPVDPAGGGIGERSVKSMRKASDFHEKQINFHYMDVSACGESFDASLSLPPVEKLPRKSEFSFEELSSPRPFKSTVSSQPHSLPISPCLTSQYKEKIISSTSFSSNVLSSTPKKNDVCQKCLNNTEALGQLQEKLLQIKKSLIRNSSKQETSQDTKAMECVENSLIESIDVLVTDILKDVEVSEQKNKSDFLQESEEQCRVLHQQFSKILDKVQKKRSNLTPLTIFPNEPGETSHLTITTIAEEDEQESMEVNPLRSLQPEIIKLEKEFNLYENELIKERDFIERQRTLSEEKCSLLHDDFQNLKAEYASVEDYWSMKMKEEQEYYEGERKLFDEKFAELVQKIQEYETLSNVAPPTEIMIASNSSDSDRLTPIDESAIWEKQVTELEEELKASHQRVEELTKENEEMQSNFQRKLSEDRSKNMQETSDLLQQNELLQEKLRTLEKQAENVNIELKKYHETAKLQHETQRAQSNLNQAASSPQLPTDVEDGRGSHLSQLDFMRERIHQCEHALRSHQKMTCELLTMMKEGHRADCQAYQTMNDATQQAFTSTLAKCKDRTKRANRVEILAANLYIENAQLMTALQVTEQRQKEAERRLRDVQMQKVLSCL